MENPVHFKGQWEHSSHTVEIRPDGTLIAVIYDFNEDGPYCDEAWGIKVSKENQPLLLSCLRTIFQSQPVDRNPDEELRTLLPFLAERFSYHEFKSWLQERGIPFTAFHDPMA